MARKSNKKDVQDLVKKTILRKSKRRSGGLGALVLVLILMLIGYFNPELRDQIAEVLQVPGGSKVLTAKDYEPLPSKKQSPLREGVWRVVHIADGDTIDVQDDEGVKHRVRFIGSNTPETVKPGLKEPEPYGPEATAFTKQRIAESNHQVRISFDGDQIDKYGRNLAMVHVQTPQGEYCLNELLIRNGLAKAELQYRFSKGAKARMKEAQEQAQAEHLNMWK